MFDGSFDELGFTALMAAARVGSTNIDSLIDAGTDVNNSTSRGTTALMVAAHAGHAHVVQLLIARNASLDNRDENGNTAMIWASSQGHTAVVHSLILAGADPEIVNNQGKTAHDVASKYGHVTTIGELEAETNSRQQFWTDIECGDVHKLTMNCRRYANMRGCDGSTPAIIAVDNGQLAALKMLIRHGARLADQDKKGWTALHYAVKIKRADIVRLILDIGVNVDASTNEEVTALFLATTFMNLTEIEAKETHKIVKLLINAGAMIDAVDKHGSTALMSAVKNRHVAVIKSLLTSKADVTLVTPHGWTMLSNAAGNGYADVVKMLIDAGAPVDFVDEHQNTALHSASQGQDVETMRVLLDAGANVNISDSNGWNPLDYASYLGHLENVKAILAANAALDHVDFDGCTALIKAAAGGHANIVRALAEAGADLTIVNKKGNTALAVATEHGHNETVQVLKDLPSNLLESFLRDVMSGDVDKVRTLIEKYKDARGPRGNTPVLVAAEYDRLEVLKLLVFRGANLADRNESGWSALHFAAERGNILTVKFLLAQQADTTVVDEHGLRAIDIAAKCGHIDVIREMHSNGVDLRHVCVSGRSIIHYGASNSSSNSERVMKYLLDQEGAEADVSDSCGWTALHVAASKGSAATVKLLLLRGADPNRLTSLDIASHAFSTKSALHLAVERHHCEIVSLLLAHPGININVPNQNQETPLIVAVSTEDVAIARRLIDSKAINTPDQAGKTPLFVASLLGSEELVKLLLEHGARVDALTKSGENPLSVAGLDNIRAVLQLYQSSQQYHDRCLSMISSPECSLVETEVDALIPLITSVYDLRLLLTVLSMAKGTAERRTTQVAKLLNSAFAHVLANKLVLDDDACVFFRLVLEHCAEAKLLSQSEFIRWKVQVTKVNMESADWVVELKKQVHHNSYRLSLNDQSISLMAQAMREMHANIMDNREAIGSITTHVNSLQGQVDTGKRLLAGLIDHTQHLTGRMNQFKKRLEQGEASLTGVASSVNALHSRVNAGEKLLRQLVPHVNMMSGRLDQFQKRLQLSESNICSIASNVHSFKNAYVKRLKQEKRTKYIKMGCSVLAGVVGFAFAPVLNGIFDALVDLANPIEIFEHAYSECDIVEFLSGKVMDDMLKPMIQGQLERLAIPVDDFEAVLRQEIALRRPDLIEECQQRGFDVQLDFGDTSEIRTLNPPLHEEEVLVEETLRELLTATDSNGLHIAESNILISKLDNEEAELLRILDELTIAPSNARQEEPHKKNPTIGICAQSQVRSHASSITEPLADLNPSIPDSKTNRLEPRHSEHNTVQSPASEHQPIIEFVNDIHDFPYHFAIQASEGDLATFLDLTDVINSDNDDVNAVMALRLTQRSTSRVSICAAEYAYLLGHREVGDFLVANMGELASYTKYQPSTSVVLLQDPQQYPYVFAVQKSEGNLDECQILLEVVDEEVDKIDARIEAEVALNSETIDESWTAVELACHLGYVDIVKHLLIKKRVKTPVMNMIMIQRVRQRAKELGRLL